MVRKILCSECKTPIGYRSQEVKGALCFDCGVKEREKELLRKRKDFAHYVESYSEKIKEIDEELEELNNRIKW